MVEKPTVPNDDLTLQDNLPREVDGLIEPPVANPSPVLSTDIVTGLQGLSLSHIRGMGQLLTDGKDRLRLNKLLNERAEDFKVNKQTGVITLPLTVADIFRSALAPLKQHVLVTDVNLILGRVFKLPSSGLIDADNNNFDLTSTAAVETLNNAHNATSAGAVMTMNLTNISFNWGNDTEEEEFSVADAPRAILNVAFKMILAARIKGNGNFTGGGSGYTLEIAIVTGGVPGTFEDLATSTEWDAVVMDNSTRTNDQAVVTGDFVCNSGGGSAVEGKFSTDGTAVSVNLDGGAETELWFGLQARTSAEGSTFAFRVTPDGTGEYLTNQFLGTGWATVS